MTWVAFLCSTLLCIVSVKTVRFHERATVVDVDSRSLLVSDVGGSNFTAVEDITRNRQRSLLQLLLAFPALAGSRGTIPTRRTRRFNSHQHRPSLGLLHRSPSPHLTVASEPDGDDKSPALAALPKIATVALVIAVLLHAPAFADFVSQWQEIRASGVTGDDFWAPLQFWAFFAVMHPLLQPAIWIGEVLHGSPGPQIGDVMPISFILLNVAAIAALSRVSELRETLNVLLLAAFVHFVGTGIEGSKNLADYNLALNDGIRGCPTYQEVRQSSVESFDPVKYQGRWYEHAFHDWTQFSDVYDTTLDVELSKDGARWLDDFALRGPSPKVAPLSWDKSPVANGAHYFLYGKLSYPGAVPGVVQESGFGVTFPNYIVDVQKDAEGNYKEAIQFQCLERGGVRIFEGINFLSRSPEISDEAMKAMYERAAAAGMAPYGATPEQMHKVSHRSPDLPPIENSWQGLWRNIGFDKLLALLEESTHSSFEDSVAATSAELKR